MSRSASTASIGAKPSSAGQRSSRTVPRGGVGRVAGLAGATAGMRRGPVRRSYGRTAMIEAASASVSALAKTIASPLKYAYPKVSEVGST